MILQGKDIKEKIINHKAVNFQFLTSVLQERLSQYRQIQTEEKNFEREEKWRKFNEEKAREEEIRK